MILPSWLKWLSFFIVLITTLIIPLMLLETPFSIYGERALAWAQGNSIATSFIVISALTADVFLPVPNGLTNTLAGASLGWPLASLIVWIGLNFGCIFGYSVGRFAGRPLANFIVGKKDLENAQKASKNFDVIILILTRPVPAFAELSTLTAGVTKMTFSKFLIVTSIANIGVAVVFSGLGAAALASSSATIAFFGAALLPAFLYFFYKKFNN